MFPSSVVKFWFEQHQGYMYTWAILTCLGRICCPTALIPHVYRIAAELSAHLGKNTMVVVIIPVGPVLRIFEICLLGI